MQTKVISVLSEQRQTIGTNVLFSASDCYSKDNELSLPLASHVRQLMVWALEQNGFKVIKPDVAIENAWVLSCRWKRKGDKLAFTFIATPWTGGKRGEISPTHASQRGRGAAACEPGRDGSHRVAPSAAHAGKGAVQ
ncbi:MAG: hypothetical protein ACREYE_12540 [Gammaproteobacteria bacterium]